MSHTFDERFNIDSKSKENIIYDEHLIRYDLAKRFIKDKQVLDIATGSGYGAKLLAEAGAKKVIAIDIDKEAIEQAKKNYYHENIEYVIGSTEEIKQEDKSIDVVVSFETIEHLKNPEKFLSEIARVVKDDGIVIISTPNKNIYKEKNPFHYKEYNKEEFISIINKYFSYHKILEQNNGIASYIKLSDSKQGRVLIRDNNQPLYFVAVCSRQKMKNILPEENITSINSKALNNLYNNPGLKIVNKIYSLLIKIPGIKNIIKK